MDIAEKQIGNAMLLKYGVGEEPRSTTVVPPDYYEPVIEVDLLGARPRTTKYSRRVTIIRRCWWNVTIVLSFSLFKSFLRREAIHPDLYVDVTGSALLSLLCILGVPAVAILMSEVGWRREMALLQTGIATTACVVSGEVTRPGEDAPPYVIRYEYRAVSGDKYRLVSGYVTVNREEYSFLTTRNPYFTLSYDPNDSNSQTPYWRMKIGTVV